MGKIADFLLTDNWEEFQRIQLYKKIGNSQLVKQNTEKERKVERIKGNIISKKIGKIIN